MGGGENGVFLKTKIFYYLRLAPLKAKLCHSRKAAPPPLPCPPTHRLPRLLTASLSPHRGLNRAEFRTEARHGVFQDAALL